MTKPNLSLNGIPGTLWEIRRQENIHPYLGLRQAMLMINSLEKALKESRLAQKKAIRKIKLQKEGILSSDNDEDREILSDELDLAEYELASFSQLITDTEIELDTAVSEKLRIESSSLNMISDTGESLQEKYANEAFQCKLARAVVISAYSSHKMISEGAAEVIYDSACLSESERTRFEMNVVGQLRMLLPEPPVGTQMLEPTIGDSNGITATRN